MPDTDSRSREYTRKEPVKQRRDTVWEVASREHSLICQPKK